MKIISEKITSYLIKNNVIEESDQSIYEYGFMAFFEFNIFFAINLIAAILMSNVIEFVLSVITFILIRTYLGGIHLKNFKQCLLFSSVIIQVILLLSKLDIYKLDVYLCLMVVSSIFIFCVISHREEIKFFRYRSYAGIILINLFVIVFMVFDKVIFSVVIINSWLVVFLSYLLLQMKTFNFK